MQKARGNIIFLFYGLLLFACTAGCKRIRYGDNKAAGKYYNIRGFKMYCETYGQGKPLLMIHGNNGNISTFAGLIPSFTDHYKVIIADSRAQGKSADKNDSLSYEMMADDYAALLDQLHIDSAYVIGWSDGGINALLLSMRHPEKVKKMAISGANLWPDTTSISPAEWISEKKEYDQLKAKPQKSEAELHDWKLISLEWEQPHIALTSLHAIKCPTLVICGDKDIIRPNHTRLIQKNIAGAGLWIVPNSGHGTLFEHRRKFISKVSDFFDGDIN